MTIFLLSEKGIISGEAKGALKALVVRHLAIDGVPLLLGLFTFDF